MTFPYTDLADLGWTEEKRDYLAAFEADVEPARIASEHRGAYVVFTSTGELSAEITGRLSFTADSRADLPAVGDWVAITRTTDSAVIHGVLPRSSVFSRKVAGPETDEQIVAANIDTIFICSALDADLNLRRIERYLTLSWQGGAVPVVLLTKSDLCADVAAAVGEVTGIAAGADVIAVSVVEDVGLSSLAAYLTGSKTVAVLGSSGVGKSTLVNRLVGEELMTTREIRDDGKGRHTTTYRRLIPLPGGGALIDTPGMRELQLWDGAEGLESAFSEIAELAEGCRFRDCSHRKEPGCAVLAALESGGLDATRFESYRKQERELASLETRKDKRLASEQARRWKQVNKEARSRSRHR